MSLLLIQRPAALGLGAVEADELGHRQTGLELNGVHGHGGMPPVETGANLRLQRLKSRDFGLRFDANQVIFWKIYSDPNGTYLSAFRRIL